MEPLLQVKNIAKEFPGVKALDHVSLTVKAGTVHALMGENGAGKSTLMKCLFGIYDKDSGKIELEGKEINFKNSKEAAAVLLMQVLPSWFPVVLLQVRYNLRKPH